MTDDGWRDVTPTTPGFEFEVQMHPDGRVRHRTKAENYFDQADEAYDEWWPPGPWLSGWPGKGLQW